MPLSALAATTDGPNFPAIGSNDNSVGVTAWTNPGNITANDSSFATITTGATSQYLRGRDYGFAIPTNATVTGIQVTIGRKATQTGGNGTRDIVVSLFKGGTGVVGDNKADTATDWPTSVGAVTYGATNDLWGTTWTPAQINAAGFGVVLQADRNGETASVDFIRVKVTWDLTPQTITVGTPAPVSATYGDSFGVAATATSGLSVAITTTGGCTNVGGTVTMTSGTTNCVVHYNQAGDTSYDVAPEVTETVTATPKALTVTATSTAKNYGSTVTFAGTEFGATGLINADTVTSVTLTSAGAAGSATVAGSPYAITPSAAVGTGLSNYSITYVDGAFTVNTAPLTITADSTSKTYGSVVTLTGTEFTTGTLYNGDTVTSVTLTTTGDVATATVAGSPYAIVASAAVGTGLGNYAITYVDGSLTVNTAPLTITADSDSKAYGTTQTYAGTEFVATGLLNTDTVTSVTLASTGDASTATVAGSPYAIVASAAVGTGLGNYAITYVDGSLTVNTAPLTITADSDSKAYGTTQTYAGTEFVATGLLNTDTVTSVTLASTGDASTATVAGSPYAIVASAPVGTGLSNYAITYVDGSLTVTTVPLTITANSTSKNYGNTLTFAGTEFGVSGLLNTDAVTSVTLNSAGAVNTAAVAGSPYAIVASAAVGSGLTNYAITYVDGTLTVNQGSTATATVVDTPTPNSTVGTSVLLEATITGFNPTGSVNFYSGAVLIGSSSVSAGSGSTNYTFTQAGNYDITAQYAGDANNTGSTSPMITVHIVDKDNADTVTTVGVADPAIVGESVALTATVAGAYNPTGFVTFYSGSVLLGTGSLVGTSATINHTFTLVGDYLITAHYLGDENNNPSVSINTVELVLTENVIKDTPNTVTTIGVTNPGVVGSGVVLTATVSGAYLPTGDVEFLSGSTVLGTATLSGSTASLSHTFTIAGSYSIRAHYLGDSQNNASNSGIEPLYIEGIDKAAPTTSTVLVVASPSTVGDTVTLTAQVNGGYLPAGDVVFKDSGAILATVTLVGDTATYMTNAFAVGDHYLTAEYQGDFNNLGSTSAMVTLHTVQKFSSSSLFVSFPTPNYVHTVHLLTATITGFNPTGVVEFRDNGALMGTGTLVSGTAQFSTTLSLGTHSLTAKYLGDINNTDSTSSAFDVSILDESTSGAEEQSGGGRGGRSTNSTSLATYTARNHGFGLTAPPAFGGADVPLNEQETSYICAMQKVLPSYLSQDALLSVARTMASLMGRDAEFVALQLKDESLCANQTSFAPGIYGVTLVAFPVDANGIPVSSNDTWNACIRGTVTLEQIRNNTDRTERRRSGVSLPKTCSSYHTQDSWKHPDFGVYFTFDRATRQLVLPEGFLAVRKDDKVASK